MDKKIAIQDNKTYLQIWYNERIQVYRELGSTELVIVDKRPDYE